MSNISKVNRKKSSILVNIFYNFLINLSSILIIIVSNYYIQDFDYKILVVSIFILIQIISSTFIIYKVCGTIFSFSYLFYILSNCFHNGQVVLNVFNVKVENVNLIAVEDFLPNNIYLESVIYVFICHTFFVWGIILYHYYFNKKIHLKNEFFIKDKTNLIKIIGWILVVFGIVPKLYIDINKLRLFMQGSYLSTYDFEISGTVSYIGSLTGYGLIILLIAYRQSKIKSNFIILFSLIIYTIQFLSGNRAEPVIFFLTLFFIYFKINSKINFKKIILFAFAGYILIIFISIIGDIRGNPNRDNLELSEMLLNYISLEPINRVLFEFGGTLLTVGKSVLYFPEYAGVQFGFNYLIALLFIFPNFGYHSLVYDKIAYVLNFPNEGFTSVGGSYIGESYYSFNIAGPIIVLFIGVGIAFVSTRIDYSIYNKNWLLLIALLPFIQNLLFWNRDYFGSMIRNIVWFELILFILIKILSNRKIKS